MYTLEELKPKIIEWANERDLIHSENADKQRLKLIEECGELASAILKNDIDLQRDSIGDIFVVLTILEAQIGIGKLRWHTPNQGNIIQLLLSKLIAEPFPSGGNIYQIAVLINHDLTECANLAYNEIKDRKGKTENGTFIKDSTRSDYIMD